MNANRKHEAAHALLECIEENSDGEYQIGALVAIGYALLDVADAIREQSAGPGLGGICDALADVAHAARRPRG